MKQNNMDWDELVKSSTGKCVPEVDVRRSVRSVLEQGAMESPIVTVVDALVALFESRSRIWALGGCLSAAGVWAFGGLAMIDESIESNGQFEESILLEETANYIDEWADLL